jgi:hypothetical protein
MKKLFKPFFLDYYLAKELMSGNGTFNFKFQGHKII